MSWVWVHPRTDAAFGAHAGRCTPPALSVRPDAAPRPNPRLFVPTTTARPDTLAISCLHSARLIPAAPILFASGMLS